MVPSTKLLILSSFLLLTFFTSGALADAYDQAATILQRTSDQIYVTAGINSPVPMKHRTGFFCIAFGTGFPIMTAMYDGREMPAIVGGRIPSGKPGSSEGGRFVALGHDAALDDEPEWMSAGSPRKNLFTNIFNFAGAARKDRALLLWGCYYRKKTEKALKDHFDVVDQAYMNTKKSRIPDQFNLTSYNVVVILGEFSKEIVPQLLEFSKNGGGIIQAATNWWYGVSLKGNMAGWPTRTIMELAGIKFRANPYYHTQGGGEYNMLPARGQFEGGCNRLGEEVV